MGTANFLQVAFSDRDGKSSAGVPRAANRRRLLRSVNGFHEKAPCVKVNVVTEASTIQDKTPFRYASIRTPFEPALRGLSAAWDPSGAGAAI